MSKAPEKEAGGNAAPSGKKQKLVIIIAVVVVLVLGGVGALLMMKKNSNAEDEEDAAPAKTAKAHGKKGKGHTPAAPPTMFKLEPFVVKLRPEEGKPEQYMQTVLELEVLDSHTADLVKPMTAKIRSKVLLMLMSKQAADLSTPKGVESLTIDLRNEINTILLGGERAVLQDPTQVGPDDLVLGVYMTQFIIQ